MWTFILIWIACSVGAAGLFFAWFQGEYQDNDSRREDLGMAVFFSFGGPFSLFVAICLSGFAKHGWRLR